MVQNHWNEVFSSMFDDRDKEKIGQISGQVEKIKRRNFRGCPTGEAMITFREMEHDLRVTSVNLTCVLRESVQPLARKN